MQGSDAFPDPASQAQSGSVHGPSIVVNHGAYEWHDAAWQRPAYRDLVIYELHLGTFTESGTFPLRHRAPPAPARARSQCDRDHADW
jgi:maltooligosyltrehalose trehalohydrolase